MPLTRYREDYQKRHPGPRFLSRDDLYPKAYPHFCLWGAPLPWEKHRTPFKKPKITRNKFFLPHSLDFIKEILISLSYKEILENNKSTDKYQKKTPIGKIIVRLINTPETNESVLKIRHLVYNATDQTYEQYGYDNTPRKVQNEVRWKAHEIKHPFREKLDLSNWKGEDVLDLVEEWYRYNDYYVLKGKYYMMAYNLELQYYTYIMIRDKWTSKKHDYLIRFHKLAIKHRFKKWFPEESSDNYIMLLGDTMNIRKNRQISIFSYIEYIKNLGKKIQSKKRFLFSSEFPVLNNLQSLGKYF